MCHSKVKTLKNIIVLFVSKIEMNLHLEKRNKQGG